MRLARSAEACLGACLLCGELDGRRCIAADEIAARIAELHCILVAAGEDRLPGPDLQAPCDDLPVAGIDAEIMRGATALPSGGGLAEVDVKTGRKQAQPTRGDDQLATLTQRHPRVEQIKEMTTVAAHGIHKPSGRDARVAPRTSWRPKPVRARPG